jgi:hypothetical protein
MSQHKLSHKALDLRQSNLADDLLPNISAIAEYVYGEAKPSTVRRLRHLIDKHGFPIKRAGAKIEGRKSWCDTYYAEPDSANGTSK